MDDAEADVLAFMMRTDRVRTSKKQVCEKWMNGRLDAYPEFLNFPDTCKKFPVL